MLSNDRMPVALAGEIIESLYERLLFRPVDPGSIDDWSIALSEGSRDVGDPVAMLLGSDEFRTKVARFCGDYVKPQGMLSLIDVSQNGELSALRHEMVERAVAAKVVVDVGAHGRSGSNSFNLMSLLGWRGVLAEPNPARAAAIEMEFAGLDYQLVDVAAASFDGPTTLHLGVHDEISSIHRGQTEVWGPVHAGIAVRAERLPSILRRTGVPPAFGLLSVDAEGEGSELIEDALAEGFAPSWIIVEVFEGLTIESLDALPFGERLKASYRIAGRTFANLILSRR